MTEQDVVTLIRNSLWIIIKVSSPILLSALIVGLVVGILQTTTSIQEPTIAFVPKLLAIFFVIVVFSSWMIRSLVDYTRELFFIIERL